MLYVVALATFDLATARGGASRPAPPLAPTLGIEAQARARGCESWSQTHSLSLSHTHTI